MHEIHVNGTSNSKGWDSCLYKLWQHNDVMLFFKKIYSSLTQPRARFHGTEIDTSPIH